MKVKKVTAAIIQRAGLILIAQRSATDPLALQWEFPGGKIEPGETPAACLVREIEEELGLQIHITKYCMTSPFIYASGKIELIAYHATIINGIPQLRVHAALQWANPSKWNVLDFAPADRPIAHRLQTERKNSSH